MNTIYKCAKKTIGLVLAVLILFTLMPVSDVFAATYYWDRYNVVTTTKYVAGGTWSVWTAWSGTAQTSSGSSTLKINATTGYVYETTKTTVSKTSPGTVYSGNTTFATATEINSSGQKRTRTINIATETTYSKGTTKYTQQSAGGRYDYPDDGRSGSYWYVYAGQENSPTVSTSAATSIATTGAILNGSISANGGAALTDYGFYWGTSSSSMPNKVQVGTSTISGSFSKTVNGFTQNTTYYFRAYATNSAGTSYGSTLSFKTTTAALPVPGAATITTPVSGQIYSLGGSYSLTWNTITNATETQSIARVLNAAPVPGSDSEAGTDLALSGTGTSRTFTVTNSSTYAGKWVKLFVQGKNGTQLGTADTKYVQIKPATPGTPAASLSGSNINVSWSTTSGAASYNVYRATSSAGTYTLLGNTSATSYSDTTAAAGTTYYYKVAAVAATTTSTDARILSKGVTGDQSGASVGITVKADINVPTVTAITAVH